jgi:hypothetical protein
MISIITAIPQLKSFGIFFSYIKPVFNRYKNSHMFPFGRVGKKLSLPEHTFPCCYPFRISFTLQLNIKII